MTIVQRFSILLIIIYVCIRSGYPHIHCGSERFGCHNGECIAGELLCNGRADCTDSSDETEDECKKPEIQCLASAFRCNYGACINRNYTCNGIKDCIDNSDEIAELCGVIVPDRLAAFWAFEANITEFSWHATIYRNKLGEKKFICGATIIQENFLITAAHCVYDESTRQLYKPSGLYILTGNKFRDYDSPSHNSELVRRNQVKRIYIDRRYLGFEGNFLWDIAILELVTPFIFSAKFVPAYLNTLNDGKVLEDNFLDGRFGKIAGFGKTQFDETSAILQALTVPVIPISQCLTASQKPRTQRFFTYDKFCAGYTNGSSICDGDSGGGLVFLNDGLWYLRGIVSVSLGTKEEAGTISCDNYLYTLYTDVTKHISWIQRVITQIKYNQTDILCSESSVTRCSRDEIYY